MEIPLKNLAIIVLVAAVLGDLSVRQFLPREVTKTQVVEKEVTKTQDVVQNRDIIVTREIIRQDGSKEIDTTVTKNTTDVVNKTVTDDKKTTVVDVKSGTATSKLYNVALSANMDVSGFKFPAPAYQLSVSKKILGPAFLGVSVDSKATAGVFVGVEF